MKAPEFLLDEPTLSDRGVYELPYLDNHDRRVLVAVSSGHRKVGELAVIPSKPIEDTLNTLWDYLDKHDPVGPRLAPEPTLSVETMTRIAKREGQIASSRPKLVT